MGGESTKMNALQRLKKLPIHKSAVAVLELKHGFGQLGCPIPHQRKCVLSPLSTKKAVSDTAFSFAIYNISSLGSHVSSDTTQVLIGVTARAAASDCGAVSSFLLEDFESMSVILEFRFYPSLAIF